MSLLTLVQNHCRVNGLNYPSAVVGSSDTTILQILALLNDLMDLISDQSDFQGYTNEATFTLTAAADQGAITDLADAGFLWMLPGTFWDRTQNVQIMGPLNEVEWQKLQALGTTGTLYSFRFRGNHLLIHPTPTSSGLSDVAFEYASSYGVVSSGGTAKQYFTVDTDVSILPEKILRRGLSYRWKEEKGLNYQHDEKIFWDMVNNQISRDKANGPVNLAGCDEGLKPSITVPLWNTVS